MDRINARNEPMKPFPKPSEGTHQCVLVDVIDLGYRNKEYMGEKKGFKQYAALVWQLDEENPETGKPFEVAQDYVVSMFELAKLRKLLEQWRGKTFSEEEAEQGVPLDKLYGVNGLMQIEHVQSKSHPNRTYTNIVSITPLPRQMEKMQPAGYRRDEERWKSRKGITYEAAFTPESARNSGALAGGGSTYDDFPAALEDQDDDLPF